MPRDVELSVSTGSTTESAPVKPAPLKGGNSVKEGCMTLAAGCGIAFFPGVAAAGGALTGAIGAAFLKMASDTYNSQEAAKAGAAGSAVLAIPITVAIACFACLKNNASATTSRNFIVATALLTTAFNAMSGALGSAITSNNEMSVGEATASTALGMAAVAVVTATTVAAVRRCL